MYIYTLSIVYVYYVYIYVYIRICIYIYYIYYKLQNDVLMLLSGTGNSLLSALNEDFPRLLLLLQFACICCSLHAFELSIFPPH